MTDVRMNVRAQLPLRCFISVINMMTAPRLAKPFFRCSTRKIVFFDGHSVLFIPLIQIRENLIKIEVLLQFLLYPESLLSMLTLGKVSKEENMSLDTFFQTLNCPLIGRTIAVQCELIIFKTPHGIFNVIG